MSDDRFSNFSFFFVLACCVLASPTAYCLTLTDKHQLMFEPTAFRKPISHVYSYFYFAPGVEGSQTASYFVALKRQQHVVWVDPGSIVLSGSFGYRYVLDSAIFNQHWFVGILGGHRYYGKYKIDSCIKDFRMKNIGLEIGSSALGQLTLNGYWSHFTQQKFYQIQTYSAMEEQFRNSTDLLDHWGLSGKWLSLPIARNIQLSMIAAYSKVNEKQDNSFKPSGVFRVGAGVEITINAFSHLTLQWVLFDKHKPFDWQPDIGIKLFGAHYQQARDRFHRFQGRLKRPPQYHMPLYADFAYIDCFSFIEDTYEAFLPNVN